MTSTEHESHTDPGNAQPAETAALADGHRATDVGNAARLVEVCGGRIRYVRAWKKWLVYRGGCWIVDPGEALITEAGKRVARRLFTLAIQQHGGDRDAMLKHARRCESAAAIAAMIKLARGAAGVLTEHDELDRHPDLLNVTNGLINLQTGEFLDHDPKYLITVQAPTAWNPDADAPLFSKCINMWQPDKDVREYLQRAIGSGLTGHPVERLFVNVGGGANGKSKFFGAIQATLGAYFVVPHKSLLIQQRHEQHPTYLAALFGARMIVAPETEESDRLNEAQIKNLTGGDPLEARRMHEDQWKFMPTWTAFVHSNHKLKIHGTDEAIWRRVRLTPWAVTVPAEQRDEDLLPKLAAEASGILRWMVEGAHHWYWERDANPADRTPEPEAVLMATANYRTESDAVARFLDERTTRNAGTERPSDLYDAWRKWCGVEGEDEESLVWFAKAMDRMGVEKKRSNGVTRYCRIQLLSTDEELPE